LLQTISWFICRFFWFNEWFMNVTKFGLYNKVMHQNLLNLNWGCQDGLPP
jgi:hypothetical protein